MQIVSIEQVIDNLLNFHVQSESMLDANGNVQMLTEIKVRKAKSWQDDREISEGFPLVLLFCN